MHNYLFLMLVPTMPLGNCCHFFFILQGLDIVAPKNGIVNAKMLMFFPMMYYFCGMAVNVKCPKL